MTLPIDKTSAISQQKSVQAGLGLWESLASEKSYAPYNLGERQASDCNET